MDRRRAAGVLLALAACFACSAAAPTASNQTALDLYEGGAGGCYYNFQHYGEGDRIMTNEPCLNCTCHNKMLMCYLRVCPFTKAIGQDCTVEKRADQCCPIVTCPDVPVDLLTSTSTTSPAEYGATGVGKVDKYGCSISGKYFPEGSKVPPTPNKPCEHCYCIRNMTTCVMQECTLHVDGCTPIYHKDVCCPVRYSCDHPEDEMLLLDDMSTTVRPTPGFLLTTTTASPVTQMTQDCVHDEQIFADGTSIQTEKPCEHCYCMKGDIVCVVQECGTPMENEGKNCTSLPPREGQCCPDTYICEGDVISTDSSTEPTTEIISDKLTTLLPPMRGGVEGSGYRLEPDELPTVAPTESEFEGSGDEKDTTNVFEPVTSEKPTSAEDELPALQTDDNKTPDSVEPEKTTETHQVVSELDTQTPQTYITSTTPKKEDFEKLTTSEITEEEILAPHDRLSTSAPTDESYEGATTEISEPLTTDSDKKQTISSDSTSAAYKPESETTTFKQVDDLEEPISTGSLTTTPSAENLDKIDRDSSALPEIVTPSSVTTQDESMTPVDYLSPQEHEQLTTTEKDIKEIASPSSEIYGTSTSSTLDKGTTEPDHAENTIAVAEEDNTPSYNFAPSTTTKSVLEEEDKHSTTALENDVTESTGDKEALKPSPTTENTINEVKITTEEPDKGLNTIPNEIDEEATLGSLLPTTAAAVELKTTESSMFELSSKVPEIMSTRGEQFTVTTEPSFRKEDDIIVSTEKPKEATTVKPEFIDDGLIPTSSQDDRYNTGSEVSHTEDDVTTSIPEFVEFTEPTESYPQTSIIPDQVSEITGKPEYEIPSSTEKPDDVSAFIPVVTETHDEGSRIPGEGDCLLEGITYRNNTVVPSSNNCHAGCKCVSSIIKCDPIICSPPPSYNGNCQTIYDSPDACCPTYVCDHPRETVPPQSDNQMSGTESPMSRPSIECDGDQCEIIPPKQQHPEPSCGPEGCGADTQKPDALEPSYKEPTECAGDNCTPSSHTIPHKQQHPEPSCGPEGCGADTQKPDALEPSYKEPTECAGDNCTPSSHTIPPKQQHPEPSCGPEGCGMDIQKPDALEPSYKEPTECAGDNCTPSSHTIPPKQQHPEPSCGPEGCDAETQKPDALEPSHKEPTECAGDNCTPSSHPIPPKQQHPEPSCGPEGCGADTQKPDALEPSHKEPTECAGDNCTPSSHPIPPKQQHPEPSCGPEGCGADTQKPDALEPSHKEPTVCAGDNCTPSSQDCSGSGCQLPTSEGHEQPTQPCEGEACKAALQPTLPGLQDSAAVPCEGDSCHKVDCAGSDCEPDHIAYPMDTKDITSDDCNGEVPCRRKETPPNNAYLPAKCEGSDCVKETEITTAHSVDSSTLKQTPLEIATEIPTEQPRYPTSDITTERVKEMPTVVDVNVEVTETPERKPDLSIPTEASLVPLPDDGVTHPAEKEQENKEPVEDSQKPTDSNITGEPELHTNPPPVDKEFTKPVSFEDENKPYSTSSDDDNITKEDKLGMTEPTIEVKNVTHNLMDVGELTTVSPMLIEEYSTLTPPKENTGKPEIEDFERQTSPAIEEKSTIKPDDVDDKTESYVTAYENTEKSTVTEDIRTEPNEAMSSSKPVEILTERPTIVEQQEHKEPSTDRIDVSSEKDRYPEDSNEITTPRATEGILETEDTLVPAGVSTQKPEVEQEEEHKTTNVYDQDVTKPDEEPVTIIETVTDKPIGVSITDIPSTDEKEYSTQGLDFVVPSSTDKIDLEKDNMGESIESSTKPSLSSEIENSPKPDVVGDKVPEKSTEGHSDAETEPTIIQTEGPSITGVEETTKPFIIDESKDQEITPSGATESDKPIPSDEKPIDGEIPQIFENESTEMPASAVTTQQGISADSVDDITTIISVVDKKDTPVDIENQTEKPTDVTVHEKDAEHKDKPATDQDIIVNVGDSIKENDSTEEPSITENKDIEKPIVDDLKKPILINEEDKEVTTGVTESSSSTESIDDKNKETIMPDKEKPLIITDATDKPIIRDDDTKTTSTDVGEPGTDAAIDKEVENGNKPLTDKLDEKDVPKPLGEKETETIAPTIITEKPQELDTPEEGSGSDSHLPEDLSKPKLTTEPTIEHETNIPEKISTVGIEQSPSEAAQAPQMTTDSQKEAPVREDGLQKTTELNELEITTKPQDVYMSSAADEVTNSPLTVPTIASHKEETISDEKMNEVSTELPQTEVTFVIDTRDQGAGYTTEKSKITNALPDSQETYVTVEPSELLNKPDKDLGDGENKEPGRPESSTEKEEILPESTTPDATKPAQSYTEEEGSKMTSPIEDVTAVPEKSPESVVTQKANEDLDIANTTPRSPEKPISDTDLEYATTLPSVDKQTLKPTESAPTEHFTNADSQTQDTSETVGYTASEEKTTSKPDLMEEEKPITEIPQQQITESDESNTVSDSGNLQTTKEELVPTITDKSPIDVSSTSPKEETKVTIPESVTEQYDEPHDLVTKSPVEVSTVLNEMPSVEPSDHITSEAPLSLVTEGEVKPTEQIYVPVEPERTEVPVVVTESELQPERMPQDEKITERPAEDTLGEIVTSKPETQTESSTDKPYVDSVLPEITTTKLIEDMAKPTDSTIQAEFSETTPYLIELEEHSHKIQDDNLTPTSEETSLPDEQLSTISPHNVNQDQSVVPETGTEIQPSVSTQKSIESETELGSITTESPRLPSEESSQLPAEQDKESDGIHDSLTSTTSKTVLVTEETTLVTTPQGSAESSTETILSEQAPSETEKPKEPIVPHENVTPEEEFIFATTKATTIKQEDEPQTQQSDDKFTKPEESEVPHPPPSIPEVTKPGDIQPTDEVPSPEEEGHFPPSGSSGYGEPDYPEEDQAFGPGTCRYGGKVYVSAQQIPRDDPCDFCFCFRSDIICLQQSCPPPIHGCHEEPIQGFCCPRYECPVSMATSVNVTTTTTTTTTTLPPHFLAHAYKGAAQRRGCQIKGHTYKVGEVVRSSSGPCLHCTCGGDGQMKCDPKACTPEPMLRQMIAAAVSAKRRR